MVPGFSANLALYPSFLALSLPVVPGLFTDCTRGVCSLVYPSLICLLLSLFSVLAVDPRGREASLCTTTVIGPSSVTTCGTRWILQWRLVYSTCWLVYLVCFTRQTMCSSHDFLLVAIASSKLSGIFSHFTWYTPCSCSYFSLVAGIPNVLSKR
jgi:hypothetical protein